MAREPQTRPQQTATPLASPLQKRSQYLAQALAEMSKEPQRIAGYGDLGARLLAQAITQSASEKTDRALGAEAANADLARRRAIASGLGIEIPGEMQEVGSGRLGNPIAPILRAGRNLFGGGDAAQPAPAASNAAPMPPKEYFNPQVAPIPPVENGGALPPVGIMPPAQDPRMGPSPAQDPRLGPAPAQPAAMPQQQAGPPPQLVQQVERLLAQGTPEAYAQAEAIVQDYQQREMILASLTPEQRANPNFVYAALNNPDELGGNIAKQFAPTPLASGSVGVVFGDDRRVGVPSFDEFGDSVVSRDPLTGRVQTVATRGPTIAEQIDMEKLRQPQPVNVPQGSGLYGFDPNQPGGAATPIVEPSQRPLSESALRSIDEADANITRIGTSVGRARGILKQIESGELNLGPLANTVSATRNLAGFSDQNSLNFEALNQWAKDARNAVLQANTGVQTDQDAIRELDTILSGNRDERVVKNALMRYIEASEATAASLRRRIERRGQDGNSLTQQGGGVARVASDDDYARLPSGTVFIGPDGVERRKP